MFVFVETGCRTATTLPSETAVSNPALANTSEGSVWQFDLPAHCPPPPVPADATMTPAMVELGRHLFYDKRLSADETLSCASCHLQVLAFSDPRVQSVGVTGELTRRNAMSLVNVAYTRRLTWAHPTLDALERQALIPLFGDNPVEMGAAGHEEAILQRLAADTRYNELSRTALGAGVALDWAAITRALATFQRSLVSCDAPYDRFVAGEVGAMSDAAVRGMELFFDQRMECFHCHNGHMFSDAATHVGAALTEQVFHNTGLYSLDGSGAYPEEDPGLFELTGNPADMGRFRATSLRNIALTAPYMHDGSIATLHDVIAHYAAGGREISEGPNQGNGSLSPLKSEFVPGFLITPDEESDLVAFLEALTDESVATRVEWRDPWVQ